MWQNQVMFLKLPRIFLTISDLQLIESMDKECADTKGPLYIVGKTEIEDKDRYRLCIYMLSNHNIHIRSMYL